MARERKFSTDALYRETKHILLQDGYEGFTFGILASNLGVSRGALYKYYDHKDDLITDYMVYETEQSVEKLKQIDAINDFEDQFDYLLEVILKDTDIHRIRQMAMNLPQTNHEKTEANKQKIMDLHQTMYHSMQGFVDKGKRESKLKQELPNDLIIGFLFGTIDLPKPKSIAYFEWIKSIKEIIRHGMITEK
ncbi:TetR/AcrR family transcriptional regulator [Virgibacillus alimentarius]|uniref:TetR/AcrR family transcriptional regulator n=1 Tax=Virgibacillus alimentarius TaxID=698769 RepID=UPI000493AECE|nr:TetR/AcrR family transcriptional regulator [Virgibacillus alimentarius]